MTTKELSGIAHELGFWQNFVRTDRFLKGWVANIRTPELNQIVYEFLINNVPQNAQILDVGSGVVSILNGLPYNVTAADPLGELYELIFDYKKHRIQPPMPVPAEEITFSESYDVVHISNALDHTQNPTLALENLYEAVRHGGYLIIQGFENEATYENFEGFHQWNLMLASGTLHVNEEPLEIPGKTLIEIVQKTPSGKDWFIWIVKKI